MTSAYGPMTKTHRLIPADPSRIAPFPADVYDAAQRVCQEYRHGTVEGIPAVAGKMGVPAGTLYNKLNPHESSHHKLTVQDLIQLTVITGDLRAMQALARTMNCVLFPVPDYTGLSDMALVEMLAEIQVESGQFYAALQAGFKDGTLQTHEYAEIEREALEWVGKIAEAKDRLQGMVRRTPGG